MSKMLEPDACLLAWKDCVIKLTLYNDALPSSHCADFAQSHSEKKTF